MDSIGIVICSRLDSSRVPRKAFMKYCGVTQIEHLIERLLPAQIPIHVAIPEGELQPYAFLIDKYPKRVVLHQGFGDDPLRRIHGVAKTAKLKTVVRISHDKIFVSPETLWKAIQCF